MRHRVRPSALLPIVLLAAAPALAEDVAVTMHDADLNVTDRANPPAVNPESVTVELSATAPDGFPALPEGVTGVAYGTLKVAGKEIACAVGGSSADAVDRVLVDLNADGAFAADEVLSPTFASRGEARMARISDKSLAIGGRTLPTMMAAVQRGADAPWTLLCYGLWYRTADFTLGEKQYTIDLVDGDLDGAYAGAKDRWFVRAAGKVDRPASVYQMQPAGGGLYLDGHRFTVASLAGTDVTVSAGAATGPDPKDEAGDRERAEETWFERFADEREQFVAARGMDTARPLANDPIHWNFVSFADAKKLAAEQKKPLFVDVLAFWCVWCYRMDYYTYPDAEVAALLNEKFVPVKIIQEQDHAGDYQTLMTEMGARGIPAMGIWAPNGELVHKIGGWKSPADFVSELNTALDAAAKAGTDAPSAPPKDE